MRKELEAGLTLSRRGAAAVLGAVAAGAAVAGDRRRPTAKDIADTIAEVFGASWRPATGDGLFTGRSDLPVTGVGVAVTPTLELLRRAQSRGLNLVVAFESPLYRHPGEAPALPPGFPAGPRLEDDPVYRGKRLFLDRQDLAVYRLQDNLVGPSDQMIAPLAAALGWTGPASRSDARIYEGPPRPLRAVIDAARQGLGVHGGLRYIGDLDRPVRRVLVVPGTAKVVPAVQALPEVDLLLTGDLREWEIVEYLFDSRQADMPKALVAVGRRLSLQPGMTSVAARLAGRLDGLKVEPLTVSDPFWRLPQ